MERTSSWNRLVLSVVVGTAVALVLRAVRSGALTVPPVPAPSTDWPPLPDLADADTEGTEGGVTS